MTAIILIATKVSYQKHFPIRIYAGGGHYVQPPPPPTMGMISKKTSWQIEFN